MKEKSQKLSSIKPSFFLLKENSTPKDSLKEEHQSLLEEYKEQEGWKIVIQNNKSYKPDWGKYLNIDVIVSSASAVLFIKSGQRWFAVCFGYGHNLLDTDQYVENFGLITTLNMLDKDKIKSTDIFSPSDHPKQKRTQTVSDSSLQGHDIDSFSHILKKITGKTKDQYRELSKTISSSRESIKINIQKEVQTLGDLCLKLYNIFKKEDYKTNFPEVFYVQPVRDNSIITELNHELLKKINQKSEEVYFDLPELVDFQDIEKFQINIKDRENHFIEDLHITEFYKLIPNNKKSIVLKNLKNWQVSLLDNNENKKYTFSLLKCFVFDCKFETFDYHFSHGRWYSLNQKFMDKLHHIKNYMKDSICNKSIPDYEHQNENEYNEHLAKKLSATLLDRKCIQIAGYDKIEPCDVFLVSNDQNNVFIHVKIKHKGSSGLSHLFQQGNVSLTLLNNRNKKFIEGIKKNIPNFNTNLKSIVHYLIISNTPNIPLFSQISLFKSINDIESKRAEVHWSLKEIVRKKSKFKKNTKMIHKSSAHALLSQKRSSFPCRRESKEVTS